MEAFDQRKVEAAKRLFRRLDIPVARAAESVVLIERTSGRKKSHRFNRAIGFLNRYHSSTHEILYYYPQAFFFFYYIKIVWIGRQSNDAFLSNFPLPLPSPRTPSLSPLPSLLPLQKPGNEPERISTRI